MTLACAATALLGLQAIMLVAAVRHAPLIDLLVIGWSHYIVLGTILAWPLLREVRRSLRRQLVLAGTPVCWNCGYDLRGLDVPVTHCPECGSDCTELVRHLQRFLPEAAMFPELRQFSSEEVALDALRHARRATGSIYSHRLVIAAAAGIGIAFIGAAVWGVVDPLGQLEGQYGWVRSVRITIQVTACILAIVGVYAYAARRIRRQLRAMLQSCPN